MKIFLVKCTFCISMILVYGCRHEISLPIHGGGTTDTTTQVTPPPTVSTCSADTVYFSNVILPLINSNCATSGCHDAVTQTEGYNLSTYNGIMRLVKSGNAGSSKLVSVISNGSMPPNGYSKLTQAQLAEIEKWINQGAFNNNCTDATCDTSNISYSGSIVPILTTWCTGCHSGSAASGGVDLTVYANVKAQVTSGKLWGDVTHAAGFNAMPVGGSSLSACDLNKINAWIHINAPNN